MSESNIKKLQIIHDKAIKCIFKLQWNTASFSLPKISGLILIRQRLTQLGCKYIVKAILNKNCFIVELIGEYFMSRSSIKRNSMISTPLCLFTFIISLSYALQLFIYLSCWLLAWSTRVKFLMETWIFPLSKSYSKFYNILLNDNYLY